MARITVEDCLQRVDNRFGLIHLAAKRVRMLRRGADPLVVCKNKDIVVALREIAVGKVYQVKPEGRLASGVQVQALPENLAPPEAAQPVETNAAGEETAPRAETAQPQPETDSSEEGAPRATPPEE